MPRVVVSHYGAVAELREREVDIMRIIISPAKKMKVETDTFTYQDLPQFLAEAEMLASYIQKLSPAECQALWKCNDKLVELNYRRFQEMNLTGQLTPALLSYEGIQYQYMAPAIMDRASYEYLSEHLRILSGFYGVLKPFDGVVPYRLEMQAKFGAGKGGDLMNDPELPAANLYEFWGEKLAENLFVEDTMILNLASKEYSKCISKYLRPEIRFVTCVFGERVGEKVVEKGTFAKMARGEMVRFLAENQVETLEQVKEFDCLGYHFWERLSDADKLVFLKDCEH